MRDQYEQGRNYDLLTNDLFLPEAYIPNVGTLFRGLQDIYKAFGCKQPGREWTRIRKVYIESYLDYTTRNSVRDFVNSYKEFVSRPLALILRNEFEQSLEIEPFNFWLDKKIFNYFRFKAQSAGRSKSGGKMKENISFCYNLQQAKRTASIFDFIQGDALQKHKATLSTASDSPVPSSLLSHLRHTVRTLFPKDFGKEVQLGGELPRTACYEASVEKGGKLSILKEFGNPIVSKKQSIETLLKYAIKKSYSNYARDLHIKSVHDNHNRTHSCAKVVSISEPLKSRILTKGPRERLLLKNLQQKLHDILRKQEPFKLIGGQPVEDAIHELASLSRLNPELNNFVSGDFSAATDNLKVDAIEAVTEELILWGSIPLDVASLFTEDLAEHNLEYPIMGESNSSVLQKRGQLMGCITSFIVLCIINYGVYTYASQRYPLDLSPCVKVNGDDIIFKSTTDGYKLWEKTVNLVGFNLSPGKNYIHSEFAMVNNTPCVVDSKNKVSRLIKYNFSLLGPPREDSEQSSPCLIIGGNLALQLHALRVSTGDSFKRRAQHVISVVKARCANFLEQTPKSLLLPLVMGGLGGLDLVWDTYPECRDLEVYRKFSCLESIYTIRTPSSLITKPKSTADLLKVYDPTSLLTYKQIGYLPEVLVKKVKTSWSSLKKLPYMSDTSLKIFYSDLLHKNLGDVHSYRYFQQINRHIQTRHLVSSTCA